MTTPLVYSATALVLFASALVAAITRPLLVQRLLALNVMGAAVFLYLVSAAYAGAEAMADPVPHAMVLTGIVVAVALTAFAVGLARRSDADARDAADDDSELR